MKKRNLITALFLIGSAVFGAAKGNKMKVTDAEINAFSNSDIITTDQLEAAGYDVNGLYNDIMRFGSEIEAENDNGQCYGEDAELLERMFKGEEPLGQCYGVEEAFAEIMRLADEYEKIH
jgi:hypothetical protein